MSHADLEFEFKHMVVAAGLHLICSKEGGEGLKSEFIQVGRYSATNVNSDSESFNR